MKQWVNDSILSARLQLLLNLGVTFARQREAQENQEREEEKDSRDRPIKNLEPRQCRSTLRLVGQIANQIKSKTYQSDSQGSHQLHDQRPQAEECSFPPLATEEFI